MWLNLQGELWHGNLDCRSLLRCPLLRQSSLPLQKHARSCFGWRNSCKSLVLFKTSTCYFVIVRVSFILVRIQLFILGPSILMWGIIGYVMLWKLGYWSWQKFIQMIIVVIWWLRRNWEPSLKLVVELSVCRSSPHSCEGEICWVGLTSYVDVQSNINF